MPPDSGRQVFSSRLFHFTFPALGKVSWEPAHPVALIGTPRPRLAYAKGGVSAPQVPGACAQQPLGGPRPACSPAAQPVRAGPCGLPLRTRPLSAHALLRLRVCCWCPNRGAT